MQCLAHIEVLQSLFLTHVLKLAHLAHRSQFLNVQAVCEPVVKTAINVMYPLNGGGMVLREKRYMYMAGSSAVHLKLAPHC